MADDEQDKQMTDEQQPDETQSVQAAQQTPERRPLRGPRCRAEPVEQLSPKERRRKARSTHVGSAREPRSPEERQAERDAAVARRPSSAARDACRNAPNVPSTAPRRPLRSRSRPCIPRARAPPCAPGRGGVQ